MTWQCPNCGRTFANMNQWHSCVQYSVDHHFEDKELHLRRLFDELLRRLEEIGEVEVDAVKTSINLRSYSHFAVVYPYKSHLVLEFLADREIESPRIQRTQRLGPMRVSHFVRLRNSEEVDHQLLNWLAQAYVMQSKEGANGKSGDLR